MAVPEEKLSKCAIESNCVLIELEYKDIDKAYEELVKLSKRIPRTIVIKENGIYFHGVCKSLIFRFPDDLEVLKCSKDKIIQIKSSSRYGLFDLGVNKRRVDFLYKELSQAAILNGF